MIDAASLQRVAAEVTEVYASYCDTHDLYTALRDVLRQLALRQPRDPLLWAARFLERPHVPAICVLASPPGSDASPLVEHLGALTGAVTLSCANIVAQGLEREEIFSVHKGHTEAANGDLPETVVTALVLDRIGMPDAASDGYILEGYPLTHEQALAMQTRGQTPTNVLFLDFHSPGATDHAKEDDDQQQQQQQQHSYLSPSTAAASKKDHAQKALTNEIKLRRFHRRVGEVMRCLPVHVVPLPFENPNASNQRMQLAAITRALCQGPTIVGPYRHRVILCGGTPEQRHLAACAMEVSHRLVYISLQSALLQLISSEGPETETYKSALRNGLQTLTPDTAVTILRNRARQPDARSRGWIVTCDWTPALLESAKREFCSEYIQPHFRANRVLYLHIGNDAKYDDPESNECMVREYAHTEFGSPLHPFFNKSNEMHAPAVSKNSQPEKKTFTETSGSGSETNDPAEDEEQTSNCDKGEDEEDNVVRILHDLYVENPDELQKRASEALLQRPDYLDPLSQFTKTYLSQKRQKPEVQQE